MATINVRRLNDDVVQRLKQCAARNHRSLESEIRHILQRATDEDASARRVSFRALARRLRRKTEGRAQTPSEVLIRADRDAGHRLA